MKKMLVMLLAVMLLASFGVAVAVGQTQAEELNELGLFNGTGVTEDGQPIFELERRLTRAEALVMVLRLMGLEKQALSCELDHPFVDASGWERRYVAYAYANGITNGVSPTEFRPEDYVSPQMFTSLVLRALGYSDMSETPDFAYADALSFGKNIGLTSGSYDIFTRGDAAVISRAALEQKPKDEKTRLYEKLMFSGVIPSDPSIVGYWEGNELVVPVEVKKGYNSPFSLRYEVLKYHFPDMAYFFNSYNAVAESDIYNADEMHFLQGMSNLLHNGEQEFLTGNINADRVLYVVDSDYNVLSYCRTPETGDDDVLRFYTEQIVDGSALYADYYSITKSVRENFGKHTIEMLDEAYGGWDDGSGMTRHYPVLLDGEYMSEKWYYAIRYGPVGMYSDLDEESLIKELEQEMYYVFFCSDHTMGMHNEDGSTTWINYYFYSHVYGGTDAPDSKMLYIQEARKNEFIVTFFSREGEFLGYLIIPPNE